MLVWILPSSTEFPTKFLSDLTTLLLTFHWASPQRVGLAERRWCEHCPPQQNLTCEPASLTNCSWQTSSWSLQTWQQINVIALRKDESTHTRWKAQFIEELSLFCLNDFLECLTQVITGKKSLCSEGWQSSNFFPDSLITQTHHLSHWEQSAVDVTCPVKCVAYDRVKQSKETNIFSHSFFLITFFFTLLIKWK